MTVMITLELNFVFDRVILEIWISLIAVCVNVIIIFMELRFIFLPSSPVQEIRF